MKQRHNVVRPGNIGEKDRDREMAQAGARFEVYVRDALKEADLTLAQLYRKSGIPASTWSGWFRGVARPRRNSLVLAAPPLSRTPEQLLAVYEGQRPQRPPRTTESADRLADAIDALGTRLTRLEASQVEGFDAVLRAIAATVGDPAPTETSLDSAPETPAGTAR